MKTLLLSVLLFATTIVNAESLRPVPTPVEETKFKSCTQGDLNLLEVAGIVDGQEIKDLIAKKLDNPGVKCSVKKPRYMHPAVCFTLISQVDTFKIQTRDRATFTNLTVVVDSSYKSCLRALVLPQITKFEYERKRVEIQPNH